MSLLNSLSQLWDSNRTTGRRDREKGLGSKSNPALERLESLCLLSTLHTIVEPTVTVGPTMTNFGNGANAYEGPQNFGPSIPLFDPSLGTLVAVEVTGAAEIVSQIGVENLSHSSAATVTATNGGSFEVDGAGTSPISGTVTAPSQTFNASTFDGKIDYAGSSGHTFTPNAASRTISQTLTSPADLAFFTAATGRTAITPTLSATGDSGATAPGGNLAASVMTRASADLTVKYVYAPAAPPPSVVSVIRYGVHREQTQIIVTFSGQVDAAAASNPANYQLIQRGADGQFRPTRATILPIKEVVYNPQSNTATIVPHSFSFRKTVQLTINGSVFGSGGQNYSTVFGGKSSLGGFVYHHSGRFFAVHNGVVQFPQTTPPPGFLMNV